MFHAHKNCVETNIQILLAGLSYGLEIIQTNVIWNLCFDNYYIHDSREVVPVTSSDYFYCRPINSAIMATKHHIM